MGYHHGLQARPVQQGVSQVGVSAALALRHSSDAGMPILDVRWRRGLGSRVDLGVGVGTSGVVLQPKVLLSAPKDDRFAVAVAPAVAVLRLVSGAELTLPVLVGVDVGPHELTLIASFSQGYAGGSPGGLGWYTQVNVTASASIRTGKITVVPELGVFQMIDVFPLEPSFDDPRSWRWFVPGVSLQIGG